jgi:amidase
LSSGRCARTPLPHHFALSRAQLTKQRDAFRKIFLDWWEATTTATSTGRPYDGVIAPCFPYAGIPHSQMGYIAYTAVYNLLDYPACSFPVLDALDERLDPIDADFKPYNAKDACVPARIVLQRY